jgi:hypothetical protein
MQIIQEVPIIMVDASRRDDRMEEPLAVKERRNC